MVMVPTSASLDDLDWSAVATAARDLVEKGGHPSQILADVLSLSALFAGDFREGLARIDEAREAEPLNPIHEARLVLLLLRFGATDPALERSRSLQEQLPGLALPGFLRALATLRSGEPRRAANAAAEVIQAHPSFALARFLQADAQLRTQFKGLRKLLAGLPRGEAHAPAWLDLAAKLLLIGGEEGKALAAGVAANPAQLPPDSRERALADELLALVEADSESLAAKLSAAPIGSRAEEIILLCYKDALGGDPSPLEAVEAFRALHVLHPDRPAVRRVFVAQLTRLAVDLATREEYAEALRVVERCLQLEPHESAHHQNRAALFTLLREPDAYHDAWADFDRHQYRLALLGRITEDDALSLARPHRLFAQQARLPAEGQGPFMSRRNLGFLKQETRSNEGSSETFLVVNDERIDDDPDLLRQWVHHRRAELTFTHWSLGRDPRRFLLDPEDVSAFRARLASLGSLARSLRVLVPEEGHLLANRLVLAWNRRASRSGPGYTNPVGDPETLAARLLHLETFADLALFCLTWKPSGGRPELVEELLAFLLEEGPFFEDSLHREVLQGRQGEPSYPLKLLAGFANEILGLDPTRATSLDPHQRATLIGRLASELLTRLAYRTYEEVGGGEAGARLALTHVDRARAHDPENVRTELLTARFLLIAGHDDESRATLAKLQQSARARDPEIHSEIEELRQILDEKARAGTSSRPRKGDKPGVAVEKPRGADQGDLIAEIDRFPGSIPAYEELARKLAAEGRFSEAIDWSERAMTQCLGRDGQLRARSLNIEMLGLAKLGGRDRGVVQLYLTGAHSPALEVLAAIPEGDQVDYTLEFLAGHCHLALGRPDEAQAAFGRSLTHCTRQLHRPVLRALAQDADQPYLLSARRSIADKVSAGEFEPALREAWAMMSRLRRPESALLDLAQIHLDAALTRIGNANDPLPTPTGTDLGLCGGRLGEIYAATSDLERARRLARLSMVPGEPARKAELILRKADALEEQSALADVLARSGALLREGKYDEALGALDEAGAAGQAEPRVVRQRALLLLKLERFLEAEAVAEALRASTSLVAIEFLEGFPSLAFRQRVAVASRLLRTGDSAQALAILEGAVAVAREEAVELAYCRGFALVMDAYRARRSGDRVGARAIFHAAMDRVEPQVAAARATGHSRLIELYETIDKEMALETDR